MDKSSDIKQVKIDNWGIFFLQRLQHFFNRTDFCDLTLQFEDNVQLKVHRLVLNTCTEYFQVLENSCDMIDDCLIMPMDLQKDVVVPIVNFMYTGQLEFQLSNFEKLYAAARLMNLTVLTKLLDAQKVPVSPMPKVATKRPQPITWDLQGKKIIPKTRDADLPEQLPGRKLPIWKRKSIPSNLIKPKLETIIPERILGSTKAMPITKTLDNTPRPTRFEWPEDDNISEITSSFDDISYGSQPLATRVKTSVTSLSSAVAFEELQKTYRPGKRESNDGDNLQSVKDYLQEQRLQNDYLEQSTSQNNLEQRIKEQPTESKSILKAAINEEDFSSNKKVRFSLEGKENVKKSKQPKIAGKLKLTHADLADHPRVISELRKRYPQFQNKSIKLKIWPHGKKIEKAPEIEQSASTSDLKEYSCEECNIPNDYIQMRSYPEYHDHLLEFHPDKVDPKICTLCGYKSTRSHLLVYHQLVKHEMQPPPQFSFPRCEHCDYIALNRTLLQRHNSQHDEQTATKCEICDEKFHLNTAFVKHCHEMGHNFECAYCEKKFVRSEYVKAHMTNYHKEQIEERSTAGIKILSDVPISTVDIIDPQVVNTLTTPSSEAEALVNVASGIAASLGLVVLNDNRQYVLQEGEHQGEYILPEMSETMETTQQIIVSEENQILQPEENNQSTDELVMVLTDHNYSDGNNSIISGANSNIVVLYSHPVEGCANTTQFISAEGNIVLNSETGVIEMNGQKLAVATPEQLQTYSEKEPDNPAVESIEMIQQEINDHQEEINNQIQKLEEITSTPLNVETNEEVDGGGPEPMEIDNETCFKKPELPTILETPEETTQTVEETTQIVEETLQTANETLQNVEENPQIVEETSQIVEETSKVAKETPTAVEENQISEIITEEPPTVVEEETAVENGRKRKFSEPELMEIDEIDAKKSKLMEVVETNDSTKRSENTDEEEFQEPLVLEETDDDTEITSTGTSTDTVKIPATVEDSEVVNTDQNLTEESDDVESRQDVPIEEKESKGDEVVKEPIESVETQEIEADPLKNDEKADSSDDVEAQLRSIHETEGDPEPLLNNSVTVASEESLLKDLGQTVKNDDEAKVQDLVSDWCDDENGTQEEVEEEEKEEVIPEEKEELKEVHKVKRSCKKTPQTKALLKDWDEGSTDDGEQSGDEEPAVNPQLNNLIDDWGDD